MPLLQSIMFLAATVAIGWTKGNLKQLANVTWDPWQYWLYFSLVQTYLGLHGWWGLVKYYEGDVWKCMILSSSIGYLVNIGLNSYFWGFNARAILGMFFILVGGLIARNV